MKIRNIIEKIIDDYQFKEGIFASKYEKKMKKACELDKVKFYDKENYEAQMKQLFNVEEKPNVFDENLINSLPDYNFLGIPVKRLIQHDCSNGYCYSIILALSLCFDNFKIVTAELDNYEKYYQNHGYIATYKHCFLLLPDNTVVDTTFGIICDKDVYAKIFKPSSCQYISSEELTDCELYQYLQSLKRNTYDMFFPKFKNTSLDKALDSDEYWNLFMEWQDRNLAYKNPQNEIMEDYFSKRISRTSNPHCLWDWMCSIKFHPDQIKKHKEDEMQL